MAAGQVAGVDPKAFKIIDGKLYLAWNKKEAEKFAAKATEAIKLADENWDKFRKQE
jgi:hypothetical protein